MNQPYEPSERLLPRIYFSDDWRWEPESELTPRREVWGGLLFAFLGLVSCRPRRQAGPPGAAGSPAGAFWPAGSVSALGQSVQATHAWNTEWFRTTAYIQQLEPYINWWNMMETTFGGVFAARPGTGALAESRT